MSATRARAMHNELEVVKVSRPTAACGYLWGSYLDCLNRRPGRACGVRPAGSGRGTWRAVWSLQSD